MSKNIITTSQQKHLRACMVCSIIQTSQKFYAEGCPNCDEFLELRGNREMVEEATSPIFEGVVAFTIPEKSWVARWQRVAEYVRGAYAVQVVGNLPEEIVGLVMGSGAVYRPRDGSQVVED